MVTLLPDVTVSFDGGSEWEMLFLVLFQFLFFHLTACEQLLRPNKNPWKDTGQKTSAGHSPKHRIITQIVSSRWRENFLLYSTPREGRLSERVLPEDLWLKFSRNMYVILHLAVRKYRKALQHVHWASAIVRRYVRGSTVVLGNSYTGVIIDGSKIPMSSTLLS